MFANKYLSVIAYANGWTLWHYKDWHIKYEDFRLENFFDPIYNLTAVGDKICIGLQDYYLEAVVVKLDKKKVYCKEIMKIQYEENDEGLDDED